MKQTVEYVFRDMWKKKSWMIAVGVVLLLATAGMKALTGTGLAFGAEDFFMVSWFFLSLYDIWFLAEASSGEICDQTIQILYAAGCRRTEFSFLRLFALYLQGMLTGVFLLLWYVLVVLRLWPAGQEPAVGSIVLIYGLIHGIHGTLDRLLALCGAGRALLAVTNAAALIVLPVALSTLAAASGLAGAQTLFQDSLFGLVLDGPVNLSLGNGRLMVNLCTGFLLGALVLYREYRKDF